MRPRAETNTESDGGTRVRGRIVGRFAAVTQTIPSAAIELRQVNLSDALAIVLRMSANQDPAYLRAATRWLVRVASERPSIGLHDLRIALDALQALAGTEPGHAALAELCARHHVGDVIGLPTKHSGRP